jgi:hypothetical protein
MKDKRSLFVIRYSGPFGFIKPWTAVRDGETFSQQFLTPSMIEGMRQKLEVKEILRHRLTYRGISEQQEVTHTKAWNYARTQKLHTRARSVLTRGVMLEPDLYLAFSDAEDAARAFGQHICLARNEDLLLPNEHLGQMDEAAFDEIPGFELIFEKSDESFLVGYNRFSNSEPMYGRLLIAGNPLKRVASYE